MSSLAVWKLQLSDQSYRPGGYQNLIVADGREPVSAGRLLS
jgi:hypothetical protein